MKTFKILNHTISFDEDLAIYKDIMNKAIDYRTNFLIRYLSLELLELKSYSDFFTFQEHMYNYFAEEVSNLTKSILKIYVDYKIYDMTSELILQRNSNKISVAQKVFNTMNYFSKNLYDAVAEEKASIQESTANNVNNAIQGHYFDVYSPNYSDIVMNEWFNNREKSRVEKKREQLYKQEVSKAFNQLDESFLTRAKFEQNKYYKEIRQCIENLILPMYEDCIKDLASRGKISNGIYENLQTSKALAINENINMIKNKKELEQQLIIALQLDPYICETHTQIIKYITNDDIQEYIELIKCLKLEDEIFKIYLTDYNNHIENTKCLSILQKLTDNMDIDRITAGLLCRNEYTPESFQLDLSYTEMCFKTLKSIWGAENTVINKLEQETFISMIKMISAGSNLVYDGSINFLDYKKLYEFFLKREKQYKVNKMEQKVAISIGEWIGKHIKGIIIFIIIIAIFYFANKDSKDTKNNTSSGNMQAVDYDSYVQNTFNPNHNKNTQVTEDNNYLIVPNYESDYKPGKLNPFSAYE
mgnify:CR=1 FL=1